MSGREPVSLELLHGMVQRVLDGQKLLREDNRNMRRRLSRIEHGLLALQRADVDRTESETATQDQIDALSARLEHLEDRAG
jgi:hypothetical protein